MHGIVSLLPEPYYTSVEHIWDWLETSCGLNGIRVTPYPHFSWQIGEVYPLEGLQEALSRLAAEAKPVPVRTAGLGIFSGPQPVIYIAVVKTKALMDLHRRVWEALQSVGRDLNPYYSPDHWMPHISLAYGDLTPENLPGAMRQLAFESYVWSFAADNFSFIEEPDGQVGTLKLQVRIQE